MRIVAGIRRGTHLLGPSDSATRPTSDRARQIIFDVLAHAGWAEEHRVPGAVVLDAFAGSGALGLEALSRGASHATFMETHAAARRIVTQNCQRTRFEALSDISGHDATKPPRAPRAAQIVFLDPPYHMGLTSRAAAALMQSGWINDETLVIAETRGSDGPPFQATPRDQRSIGVARVTFWTGRDIRNALSSPSSQSFF